MIGWKQGYTKGVIGPIFFLLLLLLLLLFGLKWAEMASRTGKKRVVWGCQKREDRREKRMIGGKRGERKGKCDPWRGEGGGRGVKDVKKDEWIRKEGVEGGRRSGKKKKARRKGTNEGGRKRRKKRKDILIKKHKWERVGRGVGRRYRIGRE